MKEKKTKKQEIEELMAELARNIKGHPPKVTTAPKMPQSVIMPPKTSKKSADADARAAQELIYDAWEEGSKRERIRLAKMAISIWPDCADAYNLLAADAAKEPEEKRVYYEKGVAAGRRALGEKIFKEGKGHFWGALETRPYMRAHAGLMQCLWDAGNHDAAIDHAREMLKLNPNDNQGIRYILAAYLAELSRFDDLDKFINSRQYKNDCVADWFYTRALLSFAQTGDSEKSRHDLTVALKSNPHAPKYLTGKKAIPRILPDSIAWGGEDEALCYAAFNRNAWQKVPGALEWMATQTFTKRGKKA